ncbi:MAG: hypothetical protein UHH95_04210, partial [Oscillospiraceae bacterium]|nr:hypothetical protein [Oscillospiraceae bacterium]
AFKVIILDVEPFDLLAEGNVIDAVLVELPQWAVIVVAASAVVYCLADFFFFYVLRSYENVGKLFVSEYLPALFKTCVFGAGIAFVTEKIYKLSPARAKFDQQ